MTDDPVAIVPAPSPPKPTLPSSPDERRRRFAAEYLKDRIALQAAIRTGYSKRSAGSQGHRLLKDAEVLRMIAEGDAARALRVNLEADDILRDLDDIRKADPRELVEFVVDCCRYCNGTDHRYQRTPAERDAAWRDWDAAADDPSAVRTRRRLGVSGDPDTFDELGGSDFHPSRAPMPDCPECFGRGVGRNIVKDQRTLSRQAQRLLAGVRQTKDGVEVKMHDPLEAMQMAGRHLRMWNDQLELGVGETLPPGAINLIFVASNRERPII